VHGIMCMPNRTETVVEKLSAGGCLNAFAKGRHCYRYCHNQYSVLFHFCLLGGGATLLCRAAGNTLGFATHF